MIWGETPLFSLQHPHLTSWTVGKSQVFHKKTPKPWRRCHSTDGAFGPGRPECRKNPEPRDSYGQSWRNATVVALKSVGAFVSSIRANIDSYWLQQPPCPPECSVCHVNRSWRTMMSGILKKLKRAVLPNCFPVTSGITIFGYIFLLPKSMILVQSIAASMACLDLGKQGAGWQVDFVLIIGQQFHEWSTYPPWRTPPWEIRLQ